MKRFLSLVLAALMLLACGCAPAASPSEEFLELSDLEPTAANDQELRIVPNNYGYIRGGTYVNETWRPMNAGMGADTNNGEPLFLRLGDKPNNHDDRKILLAFDISSLKEYDFQMVYFCPTWSRFYDKDACMSIYDLGDAKWSGDTLTWNNAPQPSGDPVVNSEPCKDVASYDITPIVKTAMAEGRTTINILIESTVVTNSYLWMEPKTTMIVATSGNGFAIADYTYQLLEDEKANKAIWDYAEQMYDEWYVRYQQLLKTPTPTTEHIVSDQDEFNRIVMAGTHQGNVALSESSLRRICPTRTYDALDDLGDYSDYDKEYPYDIYGGLMNPEMKQEATGFFYTKKLGDRWWFIDPLGFPCYIRALHQPTLSYRNFSTKQKEAAMKMYGSEEKWRISVCRWIQEDLYFNAINASNVFEGVEEQAVYQTGLSSLALGYANQLGVNASTGGSSRFSENNTMPVFDPGFVQFCNEKAAAQAPKYKDDPWFLGYTTDNELPLDGEMLYNYLKVDPKKQINGVYVNHYSYAAAWTFLKKITGSEDPRTGDVTEEILELFRGFVYDRYFNVADTAIKAYDPNHMYLGCRFVTNSSKSIADAEWVARFSTLYLDAATINWYGQWTIGDDLSTTDIIEDDDLYKLCNVMDIPMILSEFYAKGMENDGGFSHPDTPLANSRGAGWAVKTQAERGYFYQNYTLRLLECKNVVGWYWFMYIDNDDSPEAIYKEDGVTWRDQSSVDVNKGIVNNWHQPYEEICEAMAEINKNVYRLAEHFDAKYAK